MDTNNVTTPHGPSLTAHGHPLAKKLCVGISWSAPDKTTWVIRGRHFKPGAKTEEEVIALVREEMGSCSNGKLQQKAWCRAAAPAAWRPDQFLTGVPAGAASPMHGYGTHPLTYTSFTLCAVPATATICYRCLPAPLCFGDSFFYCSTAPKTLLFKVGCMCCFCWSGLSFWTGIENEKRGIQCINF